MQGVIPITAIADAHYTHEQTVASATWTVTHNMGKYPSVSVVDTGDNVIVPDVEYIDTNSLTILFSGATAGNAYLN
ncbi:MAG: hypothetical protein M9949_04620 [Candidatus Kapabacteria bacterium]|nr:hypothetical protein [Candidatus Kapabacteria bacterium]